MRRDPFSAEKRSAIMRAVKGRDTGPERLVRKIAFGLGYRYRLNRRDLPGAPDLVFPGRRRAIFVHGCFWHGHKCRRGDRPPAANAAYWSQKVAANRARDAKARAALRALGWSTLTLWECELGDERRLKRRIAAFLG
jgi:DNA mismatch endonuclease (patch repair protein)